MTKLCISAIDEINLPGFCFSIFDQFWQQEPTANSVILKWDCFEIPTGFHNLITICFYGVKIKSTANQTNKNNFNVITSFGKVDTCPG